MKVGFFGTPQIAADVLKELFSEFSIEFLVTSPDKPKGRSKKLIPSEAKQIALEKNIPLYQPTTLKDEKLIETLKQHTADIFVVVAYGKIIPRNIFDLPRLQTINMHPSLLPLYRGAAPVQWALINGEIESGVTVQLINEELDAGDILLQEKFPINENATSKEIFQLAIPLGITLLKKAIYGLNKNTISPLKQNDSSATYCGKIDKEIALINWQWDARKIHNLVRGCNPKPVAWTSFREKNIKIWETSLFNEPLSLSPGEIFRFQKKHLLIGTGNGIIKLHSLQPEDKKVMDGISFFNGSRIEKGEKFKLK